MEKQYVPPEMAYQKLRLARNLERNVYLYGATGFGKTTLLKQYLDFRSYRYWDCRNAEWEQELPGSQTKSQKDVPFCVVIDNIHLVRSREQKEKILTLMDRKDVWLVLAGRSKLPLWLKPKEVAGKLFVITEQDLRLTEKEVLKIAEKNEVRLNEEKARYISTAAEGNAYAISLYIMEIKQQEFPSDDLLTEHIAREFVDYLDENVISLWDADIQDFMIQISVVETFNEELAEYITGEDKIAQFIDRMTYAGNFLIEEDGMYRFRTILRQALMSRGYKKFGKAMMNQFICNAGRYYEHKEDIMSALQMYEMIGESGNIRSLLIRNGRRNPGSGYYYELRKYYLSLPEEEVKESAVLMSALSMLYSILMNEEKSEYWYSNLRTYAERERGGAKREAITRLAYLDIALPHRGSVGIIGIMKNIPKLLGSGTDVLPEMSVTNNQPSTMNGGKDFCEWSKEDVFLANSIGKLVEKLLGGGYGKGLVDAALGESFYEKGMDNYKVLMHLTKAQIDSQEGGKIEIAFVSVGLQVRLNIVLGDINHAKKLLSGFEERMKLNHAQQLIPNFEALKCRVALYSGEYGQAEKWINEKAPDELKEFCTLERYRYLTKLRYYIICADYTGAVSLIGLLRVYAGKSKRTYILMELDLLESVIRYRQKQDWKELFIKALLRISEYKFVRLISEEGALVYPLLKEIEKNMDEYLDIPEKWFQQVIKEAKFVATRYPAYGGIKQISPIDFKPAELQVLQMQADGKTQKEIADALDVTLRTVKYYARENYRKLGAAGKTDAVQKARSLNLI